MSRPTMTEPLARAAAADSGNARMRAYGRTKWNAADYRHAAKTYAKLLERVKP